MPDPEMKTVSASQAAALWNVSPYMTRWMLWQKFANGLADDDEPETERMKWGKLLEPLVLAEASRKMKLETRGNKGIYFRRGLLGATRDATIVAPDRGPGAVEVKCVFDYSVWAQDWDGGRKVPKQHEIQLQTQMFVGDGDGYPQFQWGLIVAWVCADLYFYERTPIVPLWAQLGIEAGRFFRSIEEKREPDPFGAPVEIPWLTSLYQTDPASVLDLSSDWQHVTTAADLRDFAKIKEQKTFNERVYEQHRARFLGLAKEAAQVLLPCGFSYRVVRSGKGKTIAPFVPEVESAPPPVPEDKITMGM